MCVCRLIIWIDPSTHTPRVIPRRIIWLFQSHFIIPNFLPIFRVRRIAFICSRLFRCPFNLSLLRMDDNDDSYECSNGAESAELVAQRLPSSNNVIRGQRDAYAVGKKIAPGKYGAVYEVLRRRDGKMFAAKLEVCNVASLNALNMDYVVLKAANKAKLSHFCTLVDRGMIKDHFKFLIMNMLGDNLYKLRLQFQQHRFSAPTSLRLALEMLESLQQLHSLGYVHRDVKPSNFALSDEIEQNGRVILLDFGLCRHYQTAAGGIKPPRDKTQFRGSARYASLAAHRELEQSPKDDLESWFYVVVEFMTGDLPWSHFTTSAQRDSVRKAKEHARTLDGMVHLLKYCPRMEFKRIITYVDGLQYSNVPDYQYLRNLVVLAMRNNDIRPDEPYDWEQQQETYDETAATPTSSTGSTTTMAQNEHWSKRTDNGGGSSNRRGEDNPSTSGRNGRTAEGINGETEQKQQQMINNNNHNQQQKQQQHINFGWR